MKNTDRVNSFIKNITSRFVNEPIRPNTTSVIKEHVYKILLRVANFKPEDICFDVDRNEVDINKIDITPRNIYTAALLMNYYIDPLHIADPNKHECDIGTFIKDMNGITFRPKYPVHYIQGTFEVKE